VVEEREAALKKERLRAALAAKKRETGR